MTLRHLYRDLDGTLTDMSAFSPRLVQTQSRAEESAVGSWSVVLDDPNGELDIVGHRNWFIEDTDSEGEDIIIWGGFTGAQTIARMQGEDHRKIGPDARVISVQLFDANSYLARIVMKGADTNRDPETDVERMLWLLGTDEADALGDVTTYVDTSHPVDMDGGPLRGTYFGQIISDCAEQSGKNHFAWYRWADGARKLTIWYGKDTLPDYVSPFFLSNDLADITQTAVDNGTAIVWPLSDDATMERSPERQYCGCYMTGGDAAGATYRHNAATHALIAGGTHQHRDMTAYRPLVKTQTKLQARAARVLLDVQEQDVRIKTTITNVLQERVTLVKAGMRIKVKGTHWWPSVDDWHNCRVLTAEPRPVGRGKFWDIPVELQVIDPGPDGVVAGPPGESIPTTGGVLWQPGADFEGPGLSDNITWAGSNDHPGAGYPGPGGPFYNLDTAAFSYIGTAGAYDGYTVVAATGSLDIYLQFDFVDVAVGSARTYTARLLLNGSPTATQAVTIGPGFATYVFMINVSDLAVVAGDTLTVDMTVNVDSGTIVPAGTGATSNRFQILPTSTVTL